MRLETWHAPPGDRIPNHPSFAVLIYHGVDGVADGPDAARRLFAAHGWGGSWVDGVFDFHHFHSTSHEALAVVAGAATIELGGPRARRSTSPRATCSSSPPAPGTAARPRATGSPSSAPTPAGQEDYDLLRGDDPDEVAAARERIAALGAPPSDPVGGEGVGGWR